VAAGERRQHRQQSGEQAGMEAGAHGKGR
jgi:hypothetical protein